MAENFDFIMANQQQTKSPLAGGSQKQKIIIFAVGILVLLLLGFVFYSLVFSSSKSTKQILLPVAGVQADIKSLTEVGKKDLRDSSFLNDTTTTSLVVTTHSNLTNSYLGEKADKQTAPYQNTSFNSILSEAAQTGSFDQEYVTILSEKLDLYKQRLVTAYDEVDNLKIKKELASMHSEAKILTGEPISPAQE